jgi:hypothetical protein
MVNFKKDFSISDHNINDLELSFNFVRTQLYDTRIFDTGRTYLAFQKSSWLQIRVTKWVHATCSELSHDVFY